MKQKNPDIFVGLAHADGSLSTLQRRVHNGFTFYVWEEVLTKIYVVGGIPDKRKPRGIREARQARREWIAAQKAKGLTVKGVRYINMEMIRRFNTDRFEIVERLEQMFGIARVWAKEKGFIMLGVLGEYSTRAHDPDSFGEVTYGTISHAVRNGTAFEVKPKADAEEI